MEDNELINRDEKGLNDFLENNFSHVLGEPDFFHTYDWYIDFIMHLCN